MNRYLLAVFMIVSVVSLVSFEASAEEGGRVQVQVDQEVSPEQAACIRACLGGRDPSVVPTCVPANQDELRQRRASAGRAWRRLLDRIGDLESSARVNRSAISLLREQVTSLQRLEEFYRELEGRVADLEGRVSGLEDTVEEHGERLDALEETQGEHSVAISVNTVAVQSLDERVTALEEGGSHRRVFQLGVQLGGGAIYSLDSTLYSFGFIGPRFSILAHDRLDVIFDVQVALSYAEQPVGARVRGGLAVMFLNDRLRLDVGLSGTWAGYDSHTDAGSIFVLGDVGVEYRPHWVIGLGIQLLLGIECDPERSNDFAFGGVGTVTFYLRRR